MNKKAIFITLYVAVASFVGIGSYCLLDSYVSSRPKEVVVATATDAVTVENQSGLIEAIDDHIDDGQTTATVYMADQYAENYTTYNPDDPNNPVPYIWYSAEDLVIKKDEETTATTAAPAPGAPKPPATTQAKPPATTEAKPDTKPDTQAPTEATTAAPTEAPTEATTAAPAPTPEPTPTPELTPTPEPTPEPVQ